MRYTLQPEAAAHWAIANHSVPVVQSAFDTPAYNRFFNLNPPSRGISASAGIGFFRTRHTQSDEIRAILLEAMDSIVHAGVSAEVGITQAEERVNLALDIGR
jgi:hypothetical protein